MVEGEVGGNRSLAKSTKCNNFEDSSTESQKDLVSSREILTISARCTKVSLVATSVIVRSTWTMESEATLLAKS